MNGRLILEESTFGFQFSYFAHWESIGQIHTAMATRDYFSRRLYVQTNSTGWSNKYAEYCGNTILEFVIKINKQSVSRTF